MSPFELIDTSSWTQALRKTGNPQVRARIQKLIEDGRAAWCEMVRLELWVGVRDKSEREALNEMDDTLPRIPINDDVWADAAQFAALARANGLSIPAADFLIFACARRHAVPIECADRHYDLLEQLVSQKKDH